MLHFSVNPKTWAAVMVAATVGCGAEKPEFSLNGFVLHGHSDAWNVERAGGAAPAEGYVCVIDSGVDMDHPDLRVDSVYSRSFVTEGPEAGILDDRNGHGTHVAGIVAALDDGVGTTGLASGATIVAIKVVDGHGNGYTEDVLAGVIYATMKRGDGSPVCDVVNFSIGAPADSDVYMAVRWAATKVPFVVSAGNRGEHVRGYSPARLNAYHVFTVSAIAPDDRWPMFSNYGLGVDFAAPGVRVRSTWKDGGYATISGTSAAAAHVSAMILRGGAFADGYVIDPRGWAYTIPVAPQAPEPKPAIASAAAGPPGIKQ